MVSDMKAKLKLIDGIALAGVSDSNHWVTLDGPEDFGGFSAGPRPMELILVKLSNFNMHVDAERAKDHPKVFTKIKFNYIFSGKNIRPLDIERSIELTEGKYCSATAMLKDVVEIIHDYKIEESE